MLVNDKWQTQFFLLPFNSELARIQAMNIHEKTKHFLAKSGWSQSRLAEAIGVHEISLNRYLNAQKRKSTGERLADFFESKEFQKISQEPIEDTHA